MIVRYLRLLLAQLQASALVAAQYRADFLIDGLIELLWTATALAPLLVIYDHRASVAGWSFGEALIVVGFFTLLQALLEGIIQPSFVGVMEQIRDGTFDFVLLKPADAQFLSSTSRLSPWRSINLGTAGVLFCVAFRALGRTPAIGDLGLTVIAAGAAMTMLYSLWILLLCLAFRSARLEELTDLFTAVFDAARWPSSIFRGALRLVYRPVRFSGSRIPRRSRAPWGAPSCFQSWRGGSGWARSRPIPQPAADAGRSWRHESSVLFHPQVGLGGGLHSARHLDDDRFPVRHAVAGRHEERAGRGRPPRCHRRGAAHFGGERARDGRDHGR